MTGWARATFPAARTQRTTICREGLMSAPPINGRQPSGPPAATVRTVLTRAARRYADEHGHEPAPAEFLADLAAYLEPHVGPASIDVSDLRVRLAEAEQNLAARRAGHDQLTAEFAEARRELERLRRQHGQTEQALEEMRDERDNLAHQLSEAQDRRAGDEQAVANTLAEVERLRQALAVTKGKLRSAHQQLTELNRHVCTWEAPGPGERVKDCSCGRPYPRYLEDVEEDWGTDLPDAEPWAAVFDQLREDLKDWGSP